MPTAEFEKKFGKDVRKPATPRTFTGADGKTYSMTGTGAGVKSIASDPTAPRLSSATKKWEAPVRSVTTPPKK